MKRRFQVHKIGRKRVLPSFSTDDNTLSETMGGRISRDGV